MRWLLAALCACSLLAFLGRPPSGPLSVCGVSPGMSRAAVEGLLGRPTSVALTKSDNLTELCLTVAEYPGGPEVYYGPRGQVVNVRGMVLEAGGRAVLQSGDSSGQVRQMLGEAPRLSSGMGPVHEVRQDLEVFYSDSRGNTVSHFELGSRVF